MFRPRKPGFAPGSELSGTLRSSRSEGMATIRRNCKSEDHFGTWNVAKKLGGKIASRRGRGCGNLNSPKFRGVFFRYSIPDHDCEEPFDRLSWAGTERNAREESYCWDIWVYLRGQLQNCPFSFFLYIRPPSIAAYFHFPHQPICKKKKDVKIWSRRGRAGLG